MALIENQQLQLAVSIAGWIVFLAMIAGVYQIGKRYGSKRVADAERWINVLSALTFVCGVVQFIFFGFTAATTTWAAFTVFMQWEKYSMRRELARGNVSNDSA